MSTVQVFHPRQATGLRIYGVSGHLNHPGLSVTQVHSITTYHPGSQVAPYTVMAAYTIQSLFVLVPISTL